MRWKYYKLTLRQMRLKKPFVFFLILVFLIIIIASFYMKKVEPTIAALCESYAKGVALKTTNNVVYEYIKDVKYENLINMQKDSKNKVTSLSANVMEMNKISTNVAKKVQEDLEKVTDGKIVLPLGSIVGTNLLGGYGPKIDVKVLPVSEVEAKFKSSFESAGINQTKHSIIIEVATYVKTVSPIYSSTQKYVNEIVVAETVIVGDIPESYYNINGINNLDLNDTLDLVK